MAIKLNHLLEGETLFSTLSGACVVAVIVASTLMQGGTAPLAMLASRTLVLMGLAIVCVAVITGKFSFHPKGTTLCAVGSAAAFIVLCFCQYFAGLDTGDGLLRLGTVNRHATFESLIQLVFYGIFAVVSVHALGNRAMSQRILLVFCFLLFGVTIFGIAQKLSGTIKMYWLYNVPGSFFGPFVYENTFGAFTALTFPMLLAVIGYRSLKAEEALEDEKTHAWSMLFELGNSGAILMFFIAVLTLTSIFYAEARASAIILSSLLILFFVIFWRNRLIQRLLISGVVLVVILVSFLDFSKIAKSYDPSDWMKNEVSIRKEVMRNGLSMFSSRPAFGYGLGTFYVAAPRFLTPATEETSYEHPNNDTIELLAETGVAGFLILMPALILPAATGIIGLSKTRSLWTRALGLQAATSVVAVLLMSQFDPHLKVPSIAFLLVFQLAVLISQFGHTMKHHAASEGFAQPALWKKIVAASIGLAVLAPLSVYAQSDFIARQWVARKSDLLNDRPVSLRIDPGNPAYWQKKASAHYDKYKDAKLTRERSAHLEKALAAISKAAELAPTSAHYRFVLGQILYLNGDKPTAVKQLEQSLVLAPANRRYGSFLLSIYLAERKRVLSSVKRSEYSKKAADLLNAMRSLRNPISESQLRSWMPHYNETEIKALEQGVTS